MKKSHNPSSKPVTRRSFALSAAAAATAALLPAEAVAHSVHLQQPSAMAKLSPESQAEIEMKLGAIVRRHGSHLNDEQKADIRRILSEGQEGLEKMRAFALGNGDQPATVFKTLRERKGK